VRDNIKKFLLACALGGIGWILMALFLIFLGNSDTFSVIFGLLFAVGIVLNVFAHKGKLFSKIGIIYSVIFIAYFVYIMSYLPGITSGRISLTCLTLILGFSVFNNGINNWR